LGDFYVFDAIDQVIAKIEIALPKSVDMILNGRNLDRLYLGIISNEK
jgi:hypothetical protein